MTGAAFRWVVWDSEGGVVGVIEGPLVQGDAMLLARKRYGRIADSVQSVASVEIAAQEREASRKRGWC